MLYHSCAICAVKGFEISSIPEVGETVITTVPRQTTSPSFLVLLLIFEESSGSEREGMRQEIRQLRYCEMKERGTDESYLEDIRLPHLRPYSAAGHIL